MPAKRIARHERRRSAEHTSTYEEQCYATAPPPNLSRDMDDLPTAPTTGARACAQTRTTSTVQSEAFRLAGGSAAHNQKWPHCSGPYRARISMKSGLADPSSDPPRRGCEKWSGESQPV